MKILLFLLVLLSFFNPVWAASDQPYSDEVKAFLAQLKPQTGTIELPNGVATLDVPRDFYYLSPQDANKVLVDVWGNPSGQTSVLGMLFPAGVTAFDDNAWGVTIEYVEEGYVSDEDADEIDYDDLLEDMQDDTFKESKARVDAGYESVKLVGWAAQPYYDRYTRKLHWAQELKFGANENHTLNYNIRVLGRQGYLLLNFIAGMEQLPEIDSNLDTVLSMAEFNEGQRYEEFDPSVDKVAAYGIGALVAGKVLAKTGMLAVLLVLLKKFGILLFLPLLFVFRLFKRS